MDLDRQITPEVYFDIRLPSRICLLIIVCLALSVAIILAWFTIKTSDYISNISTLQQLQIIER